MINNWKLQKKVDKFIELMHLQKNKLNLKKENKKLC